ncbi:hypothetical protein CERSUDRAFT_35795, partial [Gelatoporia subvermispora B]
MRTGLITMSFECNNGSVIMYANWQHTFAETWAAIVCWCAKSYWPFNIIKDTGFRILMKTG